jgi:soluble lytic murein transglycosylase-like protein
LIRVSDIFQQKLADIQSRVPVKIRGLDGDNSFNTLLESSQKALDSNNADNAESSDGTSSIGSSSSGKYADQLAKARLSLSANKTSIPTNKSAQMSMISQSVKEAAAKYHIDENLLMAVIKQESGFNPYSLSSAGAQGLMQLMPGTADALGVDNPWDISENINGGAQYLKDQLVTFDGDISLALAAYNAGPGSVRKYNGIPPYSETQDYVQKVMKYYRQYSGE